MNSRRILVVGQSGAGKSTLVNALYNDSVDCRVLSSPATVSAGATGTTFSSIYRRSASEYYQDTVGFHDENDPTDVNKIIESMRVAYDETRTDFTHVLLAVPYQRIFDATKKCLALLHAVFGDSFKDKVILIVTQCDTSEKMKYEKWLKDTKAMDDPSDNKDEFKKLVRHLHANRRDCIVMGTLQNSLDDEEEDNHFLPKRTAFFEKIKRKLVEEQTLIKPQPLTWSQFFTVLFTRLKLYFNPAQREQYTKVIHADMLQGANTVFAACAHCHLPENGGRVIHDNQSPVGSYTGSNHPVMTKCCGIIYHKNCQPGSGYQCIACNLPTTFLKCTN